MDYTTPTLDPELVYRFTGQTDIRDVAAARAHCFRADAELTGAREELRRATGSVRRQRHRVAWASVALSLEKLRRRYSVPLVVCVAVFGGLLALAGAGVMLPLFRPPLMVIVVVIAAAYAAATSFVVLMLADRRQRTPDHRFAERRAEFDLAVRAEHEAASRVEASRRSTALAAEILATLNRLHESQVSRLLRPDVGLSGPEFERHLAEVFRFLGYPVEHCGQSGDQGVDLIVSAAEGRIAVQAKCYAGSVGNSAVQEAIAGMVYYGCNGCAVVTNSEFTASAHALAERSGCRLINGERLRRIITGRERF